MNYFFLKWRKRTLWALSLFLIGVLTGPIELAAVQGGPDIGYYRNEIDAIDLQILQLLNQRMKIAQSIGEWKRQHDQPIYSPEREEAVLKNLESQNPGPLTNPGLRAIFQSIFCVSRALQKSEIPAYTEGS